MHNSEARRVTVHDILQGRAIIVLQNQPFSLVSLIHDIQVVHVPTEPTTTSTDPMNTLPSDVMGDNDHSLSPGVIAAIVVISIIIVFLFTAITVVLIVVGILFRRQR